jgi:LmbE family N-acetylglucosaminyl deacetylase
LQFSKLGENLIEKLVVSPHIDDEVLGCGGTINDKTFVLECGVDDFHIVSKRERIIELEAAQKILGFEFEVLDNKVNSYNVNNLIEGITKSINSIQPKEIYIPYPSYNQDHQEVYRASMVALRHHDLNYFVPRVFVYEETQVVLWDNSHDINGLFKPNYYREIDIEKKIAAYKCLRSQVRSFRSPEFLQEIAQLRGRQSGKKYAEAFQCLRYVE